MNNILAMPGLAQKPFNEQEYVNSQLINLTEVFQLALQKNLPLTNKNSVITRLDKLPLIKGIEDQFVQLCNYLISMIVELALGKNKLFLHIKCEEEVNKTIIDLRVPKNFVMYNISLCTNVATNEKWATAYKEKLEICNGIVIANGGSFSHHLLSASGCLFSLSLPGKHD